MAHHEIEQSGLESWIESNEVTYASSTRERKRLAVNLKGVIRITVGGVLVWEGKNNKTAVTIYNSITEQFILPHA